LFGLHHDPDGAESVAPIWINTQRPARPAVMSTRSVAVLVLLLLFCLALLPVVYVVVSNALRS
jgi:hypothetical protein